MSDITRDSKGRLRVCGPFPDRQSAIVGLKCYIKYLKRRKVF